MREYSAPSSGDIMVPELDEKEKETLRHALGVLEEELKSERVKTDKRQRRAAPSWRGDCDKKNPREGGLKT